MKTFLVAVAACLISLSSSAEVLRVEVTERQDIPEYDYEQIRGKANFAIDPKNPVNAVIADLDKAPKYADAGVGSIARLQPRPMSVMAEGSPLPAGGF